MTLLSMRMFQLVSHDWARFHLDVVGFSVFWRFAVHPHDPVD